MAALWNDSIAYNTVDVAVDVVNYDNSTWVTLDDAERADAEIAKKFKITRTSQDVATDATHGEGVPAPELKAVQRPHTEQVFPFEEV